MPTPTEEENNDDDQRTSDQVATELHRSTRTRSAPEWYENPVIEILLLDNGEPSNYEEAMAGPDSNKWLESMQSEIGSMYENKVWTLTDLPDDRRAIGNKWTRMVMLPSIRLYLSLRVIDKFKGLTTMRLSLP